MARKKSSMVMNASLEVETGGPLDAREVVDTLTDLTDPASFPYVYEGQAVYVKSEKRAYAFVGDDPAAIENWKAIWVGDLLDDVPTIGNRSSFLEEHVGDVQRLEGGTYLYLYKSYDDGLALFNGDLTQYYWRVKYENGSEEFVELRNRRADTDTRFRYDLFKAFTDTPYNNGVIGALNSATFTVSRPNQSQTQWANGNIGVIGTYATNYTESQIGHPRAMSMTPYAKTTIKKMSDIVKTDLFLQGIIEEKGSSWGIAKSGRLRFVFATQQQEISDLWVDISELGLSSAEDYVVQLTITGGGTMDWGASELFVWEKRTTQFGVTCRNMTSATKDYTIVDYTVIAKGFGGGSGSGSGTGEVPTVDQVLNKGYTTTKSIEFSEENGNDDNSINCRGMSLSGSSTEGLRQVQYSQHGIKSVDNLVGTMIDIFSVDFDSKEVAMSDDIKSAFMTALGAQGALTAGNGVEILPDGTINMTKNIVRKSTVLWQGSYNDVRSGAITLSEDISEYDEICAMSSTGEGIAQVSRLGSIRFTNGVENSSSAAFMQWVVSFSGNTATVDGSKLGSNGNYQYTLKEPLTKILGIKYELAGGGSSVTVDQTYDATSTNAQSGTAVAEAVSAATYDDTSLSGKVADLESAVGDTSGLSTTATDLSAAVNELKSGIDALGEPFRVKQWGATFATPISIPSVSQDIANTAISNFDFRIEGQEGDDFQVVGMMAYEIFDESSARINCFPVCQFTGEGQKLLRVRMMCAGTTAKSAKRISAWVLLKHR